MIDQQKSCKQFGMDGKKRLNSIYRHISYFSILELNLLELLQPSWFKWLSITKQAMIVCPLGRVGVRTRIEYSRKEGRVAKL